MWESLPFGDVLVSKIPYGQQIMLAFLISFMSDIIIIKIAQFIVLTVRRSRETIYLHKLKFSYY